MSNGTTTERKLLRLRTYQDDFARARGAQETPSPDEHAPAPQVPQQPTEQKADEPSRPVSRVVPTRAPRTVEHAPAPHVPQKSTVVPPAPKPVVAEVPIVVPKQPVTHEPPSTSDTKPPQPTRQATRISPEDIAADISKLKTVKKPSILAGDENIFDVQTTTETVSEGTIVTDTKRNRFKLIPSIINAVRNWLFEKQEDYKERSKPKYTVTPAEKRKEVVERAAVGAALAPKDDHGTVVHRLRHVPRTRTVKDLAIKSAESVPEPTWAHTTTSSAPLERRVEAVHAIAELEKQVVTPEENAPRPVPAAHDVQPRTSEAAPVQPSAPAAPVQQDIPAPRKAPRVTPRPVPTPVSTAPVAQPLPRSTPTPIPRREPQPAPVTAPVPQAPEPEPVPAPPTPEPVREPAPQKTEPRPEPVTEPAPARTVVRNVSRPRSPYPLIAACGAAVIIGIAVSVWFFAGFRANDTIVRAPAVEPVMNADAQAAVVAGATRDAFLSNLAQAVDASGQMAITHLYPATADAQPIGTEGVLALMDLRAPGGFTRTITNIGFGAYRGSEPFIVLKVSSFDTALGGILEWEDSMSADLAPLFGTPVLATFDPTARTATQTRAPFFVDVVHANRDMRVLRDEAGDERIVYSFLDRSTILISTDRTVIEEVAPLVR